MNTPTTTSSAASQQRPRASARFLSRARMTAALLGALALGAVVAPTAASATPQLPAAPVTPAAVATPAAPVVTALPPVPADLAPVIDLCATAGSVALTTGTGSAASAQIWGYTLADGTACGTATVAHPGGPDLVVDQGAMVTINLHNNLPLATSLDLGGQGLVPDLSGAAASGGSTTYTFTADQPGTFIYQAGLTSTGLQQIALGLYGALVVRPAASATESYANQAYGSASSLFDSSSVLVLSELDPALTPANAGGFDMRNYAPKYGLINGVPYPNTAPVPGPAGGTVLLRYVNAGVNYHSMSLLGTSQSMIATDGHFRSFPFNFVAETFGPGQTADVLVKVPTSAANGSRLALFDGSMALANNGKRTNLASAKAFGGMMTFLTVGATAPVSGGPVTSNVVYSSLTQTLTAVVDDTTTGGDNVQAAEWFLDTAGVAGTGTPMFAAVDGLFDSVSEDVTSVDPLAAVPAPIVVPPGTHTLYVRGQDALGDWGAPVAVVVTVTGSDTVGPTTTGPTLTPASSNGSAAVAVHATADDTASGSSTIAAAEFSIDGGTPTAMTVNNVLATVASVDGSISAVDMGTLSPGVHVVSIRSQDAAGNWGAPVTVDLTIDTVGPVATGAGATPSPNNGTLAVNTSAAVVRVTATLSEVSSGGSTLAAGEFFLCSAAGTLCATGSNGTGVAMVASDGSFDGLTESVYGDIPLATVAALSPGDHAILIHGKDASGNWGPSIDAHLVIDKVAPAVTSIVRADASPTTATTLNFTVTFSEPVAGSTAANFSLVRSGGFTGGSITSIVGAGTTWTVTVSTGGSTGTVGLNLSSAAGIKDLAGNALPTAGLPNVGQAYQVLTPPLYFSTSGNSNPSGVGGTADDADIYFWNGSAFSRTVDVSATPYNLPASGGGNANVDGFDRVDATHFYLSFTGQVNVPGLGNVQDEDVVYWNNGSWSLFFDGSANGVGGTDLDAISVLGGTLYFSTDNGSVPPGAGGTGDDADIYQWNGGNSYTRVVDASGAGSIGLPTNANVDGFVRVDATHFYMSFTGNVSVPVLGGVQREDVVYYNNGVWSVYFDGTSKGLTSTNLNVDAFDLP